MPKKSYSYETPDRYLILNVEYPTLLKFILKYIKIELVLCPSQFKNLPKPGHIVRKQKQVSIKLK